MRRVVLSAIVVFLTLLALPSLAVGATVAAGAQHSVVVKDDGTVWTWGANSNGQLGDGTTAGRRIPGQIAGLSGVTAVAAGAYHTLALSSDGHVRTWGANADGQLGDGSTTQRNSPVLLSLTSIVAIAAGEYHSVALAGDGTVWIWGRNSTGQLGDGTLTKGTKPRAVPAISASAIAAGAIHTAVVRTDGTVWAWGANGNGQLGDGSMTARLVPTQMMGVTGAALIAAGAYHTLVIRTDGSVWATGWNGCGPLGDGTTTQRTSPVAVSVGIAATIAAGQYHSAARLADGTVWTWGCNASGQVGDGTTTNRLAPFEVAGLIASELTLGQSHTVARTADGVVLGWGANEGGQLGDGTTATRLTPISISAASYQWKVATPVFNLPGGTYTTTRTVTLSTLTSGAAIHYTTTGADPTEGDPIATGALSIDRTMTVKAAAWKAGQPASNVATASYVLQVATPTFAPGAGTYSTAQLVAMSDSTTAAVIRFTTDGTEPNENSALYARALSVSTSQTVKAKAFKADWAASATATAAYTLSYGTLAVPVSSPSGGQYANEVDVVLTASDGATIRYTTNGSDPTSASPAYTGPIHLSATTTLKAKAFRHDWTTSATLTNVYTLKAATPTLSLSSGSYPFGTAVSVLTATPGAVLRYTLSGVDPSSSDAAVSAGGSIRLANVTLKVSAWRTGFTTSDVATAVFTVDQPDVVPTVSAGGNHSLLLRNDGTIWAWGANSSGQIGDGTKTQRTVPIIVAGVTGATAVAAGLSHSAALTSDGQVWTWGANGYGQLGDGSTTQNSLPRPVAGLTGILAVAAGQDFMLALRNDGTVWAWGQNANGQLGDGTTTQRTVPTIVPALSGISAIAAGASHSVALSSAGSVWTWGVNSSAQLGDGTTTQRVSPVLASGLTAVARIGAGWYHSLALGSDGTVWVWGQNSYGQLGDGTTTRRNVPTALASFGPVTDISGGQAHTVALDAAGGLWSWGGNGSGQLGNGSTGQTTSPALVTGLSGLAAVSAGQWHSLAVSSDGVVWGWGLNGNAQVGDGTGVQRTRPVRLSAAGFQWNVATPTFGVAGGTYSTPLNVALTTPTSGAVIHFTTTGVDPTEADEIAGGAIAVDRTLTLKAGAWKGGMPPSNIDAVSYTLQPAMPSFSPWGGTYTTAQTVTMTDTTTGVTIRYTVDGTDPTEASPQYSQPVIVATGMSLKAKAFKPGWTPSATRSSVYAFNYGTLAPPTSSPAPGVYSDDQVVTLQAVPGATVRYTTNGTDPTAASPVYTAPLALTATTTVKAKAFQPDWAASATYTGAYTIQVAAPTAAPAAGQYDGPQLVSLATSTARAEIRYTTDGSEPTGASPLYGSPFVVGVNMTVKAKAFRAGCEASPTTTLLYEVVDTVPPTISASVDPPPNAAGWHHRNVTVTFTCADAGLPAASCTAPVTVYGEGSPIEVKGVAIDAAGNRSETTVSLNVDRSAPRLAFHAPEEGDDLPLTTTTVTVRGNVLESLSGIESLGCGGQGAVVAGQAFSCDVPVTPGSNSVTVTARDVAGLEATATLTFTVADPPAPTSLAISPRKMTMLAGESREVRVIDERGRAVAGGTWTVDQPLVAQVTVADGVTRVDAVASGEATLTVTRDGLSADAIVTVLASGAVLPEGTALWESAPLGTPSVKRGQVIRANRTDDGSTPSADLFFIDEGTQGAGIYLYRVDNRPTTIRAMTFDGQQLWSRSFTGEATIKDVAADARGGLILVLTDSFGTDGLPDRVQRIDGATGTVSWQYFAPDDGPLSEVAVHPDGRVFVSTEGYYDPDLTYLIAFDGDTGTVNRWRLPDRSSPTGPIVRDDGSVVVLFNPRDDETFRHLQLATLADGSATLQFSDTYLPSPNPYFSPDFYRLIPHDEALLVAQIKNGTDVIRIGPDNTMGPIATLLSPDISRTVAQVDYAVAGSTGMAIIRRESGQYQAPYNVYTATFDPVTLSGGAIWAGTDPYATYRFITADGQAHVSGEAGGMFGSNDTQVGPGLWATLSGMASVVIGPVLGQSSYSSLLGGGSASANALTQTYATEDEAAKAILRELNPASIAFNWEFGGRICRTAFQGVRKPFVVGFPVTDRSPEGVQSDNSPCYSPYGDTTAYYHTHGRDGNDGPSDQTQFGGDILHTYLRRVPGFVSTPVDGTKGECFSRGQGNIWKYQANPDVEWKSLNPVMLIPTEIVGCAPARASLPGGN
jgi:alpha-tubulin suppressor-like RCC1 family protein